MGNSFSRKCWWYLHCQHNMFWLITFVNLNWITWSSPLNLITLILQPTNFKAKSFERTNALCNLGLTLELHHIDIRDTNRYEVLRSLCSQNMDWHTNIVCVLIVQHMHRSLVLNIVSWSRLHLLCCAEQAWWPGKERRREWEIHQVKRFILFGVQGGWLES